MCVWYYFWLEKASQIVEEEEKEEAGAGANAHLQLIVVFLGGTDGNNKVNPVLWGEARQLWAGSGVGGTSAPCSVPIPEPGSANQPFFSGRRGGG